MVFAGFAVYGDPDSGGNGANVFEGAWSKLAKGVDDSEKVKYNHIKGISVMNRFIVRSLS